MIAIRMMVSARLRHAKPCATGSAMFRAEVWTAKNILLVRIHPCTFKNLSAGSRLYRSHADPGNSMKILGLIPPSSQNIARSRTPSAGNSRPICSLLVPDLLQDRRDMSMMVPTRNHALKPTSSRSAFAGNDFEQCERTSEAMANRFPACLRCSGQLLRPNQLVGFSGRASGFVRLVIGWLRISLQRIQLDLRPVAGAFRNVTGSAGSAARGANQRVPVERCLLRGCAFPQSQLVLRSTPSFGRERVSNVSGECQSIGLLVYERRAGSRNSDHRRGCKILQCDWSAPDRPDGFVFWLALEFCCHRLHQPFLFCALPFDLSQSQPGQEVVLSGVAVHSPGWGSARRPGKGRRWKLTRLSLEATEGLWARIEMGRLQLHFLSSAHLAAHLSFSFSPCRSAPLCCLHQRALVGCDFHRSRGWRVISGHVDPAWLRCPPCSPNRYGDRDGFRSRDFRRGALPHSCDRPGLDQPRSGRTGCGCASGMDSSISHFAEGKRRHTRRRGKLLWPDSGDFCSHRHRLYRLRNPLFRRRLHNRDGNPLNGDFGLRFLAGTHRTDSRTTGKTVASACLVETVSESCGGAEASRCFTACITPTQL